MKLLQQTSRNYFTYSVLILLIAIPAFYFVIHAIAMEDNDESLRSKKEVLLPKIAEALSGSQQTLKFLDDDITLTETRPGKYTDSFSTISLFDSLSDETVQYRVFRSHIVVKGKHYLLMLRSSMVDSDNLIESILAIQIVLLLFLLGGLFLINRKLARGIWKPFNQTLQKIKEYNIEHKKSLALSVSSIDEFNELNSSIIELTDRLQIAYQSQKEFTENASHEMQTPLAILQGKLELLMQTVPLSEEQAGLMSDMADANQRMVRLNKNLILLTRIDNRLFFVERETISLNDFLRDFICQYQPYLDEKELSLQVILADNVSINVNRSLLEILISNLISNAIRHNYTKGRVNIITKNGCLIVQNTGKQEALDEENIFRRFHIGNGDSHSLGLGLEIVKKLCSLYKFGLAYRFEDDLHQMIISFTTLADEKIELPTISET